MAIFFTTTSPEKLLAAYKKAVDDGHVTTWTYDQDGDFTHTAEQWNKKAWLRPRILNNGKLAFNILSPTDADISVAVYAIYHGRFIESMLRHCDSLFEESKATSSPTINDVI